MKLTGLILIVFLSLSSLYAQTDKICYKVTEDLKDSIYTNLDLNKDIACLWGFDDKYSYLLFFEYNDLPKFSDLIRLTNRYLYVDDKIRIPVVFQIDVIFSTIFNFEEGDFVIISSNLSLGGYYCKIDGRFLTGKVVFSEFVR